METVLTEFAAYAENLADAILRELQQLSANARNGAARRAALARVYRQAHSLKSIAQAAGLNATARLAHEFETLLDDLRQGRQIFDEPAQRGLEEQANALVQSLQGNGGAESYTPPAKKKRPAKNPQRPALLLPLEVTESLSAPEINHLREALSEGQGVFAVEICVETATFDESLRQLAGEVELYGELVATKSLGMEEETGHLRFRLIVTTRQSGDELAALVKPYGAFSLEGFAPPARNLLQMLAIAGKQAALESGKLVSFEIDDAALPAGDAPPELFAAFLHLVRNAVAHGVEPPAERRAQGKDECGLVRLAAAADGAKLRLSVSDDGRGLNAEAIAQTAQYEGFTHNAAQPFETLFRSGFTTTAEVSSLAGRGVGLDAVKKAASACGGRVEVSSEPERGSTFTLIIPLKSWRNR